VHATKQTFENEKTFLLFLSSRVVSFFPPSSFLFSSFFCFLVFLSLFSFAFSQNNCTANKYGPPACACVSDFNAVLNKLGYTANAVCTLTAPYYTGASTWVYTGPLDFNQGVSPTPLNLGTDHLLVYNGPVTFTPLTVISVQLDQNDYLNSGHIIVVGQLGQNLAQVQCSVLNAVNMNPTQFVVVNATLGRLSTDTGGFQISVPTVASDYAVCRELLQATLYNGNLSLVIIPDITPKVGFDCATGNRDDRTFALVCIILLFIHGFCVLVFCLVTCKVESLKEKIWDVDV